jgi:aminopeptidase N
VEEGSAPGVAREYRATYEQPVDLIHTSLDLRPDWEKKWMYGEASIKVKAHFTAVDSVTLDAKGMEIRSVGLEKAGGRQDSVPYRYDGKKLHIRLATPLQRTDTLTILIRYISKPDERKTGGSLAIQQDKGLYFINADGKNPDKPKELWTQGETEANSAWFPTIESPAQKMTQDIRLTVDSFLVTVSNGLLTEQRMNGDGTRTDHWRQTLPAAPYLTMIAVGPFKVVRDEWRGKEVSYYVDAPYEKYARKIFGETSDMIAYFSRLLKTDYPWEKYAQVVVHDYVSGAMENTTAVIHGTNMQQDPREMLDGDYTDYISHELFHHWFGDLVTCESWSNITLNEGFANYSEYLWREHRYGREDADRAQQSDLGGYLSQAKTIDEPLVRFHYTDAEELYDAISYNKGGRVLHMLRKEIGDSAFFESLAYYLHTHAFGTAEVHDLRMAFEKVTGRDMNEFFEQWFLTGGHPSLRISYEWRDSSSTQVVRIEQTQNPKDNPVYRLPIKVDIYLEDSVMHEKIIVNDKKEEFSFTCPQKPMLVNVDADKALLCTKKDDHTREEWRYQYLHAPLYLDRYEAVRTLSKEYKPESPDATVLMTALDDRHPEIRMTVLENCSGLVKQDSSVMLKKLLSMTQGDKIADVRKSALKSLKKNYSYAVYKDGVWNAVKDSSYEVAASAFGIIADKDPSAAPELATAMEADSGGAVLAALAEYYEKDTAADRSDFYGRAMRKSKSWYRINVIRSYGKYLRNQPDSILETGVRRLVEYCEFTPQRFARSGAIAELRSLDRVLEERMNGLKDKKTDDPVASAAFDRTAATRKSIQDVLDRFDRQQKEK